MLGLYRDNGKENGNYYMQASFCRGNVFRSNKRAKMQDARWPRK